MSDKKLITKTEGIFLIIAVLIIGSIILKNNGIHIIERAEKMEIINQPTQQKMSKKELKRRKKAREKQQQKIDEMLQKWGNQLSEALPNTAAASSNWKDIGLSKDEVKFHKKMSARHNWESRYQETNDWFAVLQASRQTYSKVKNIFQDPQQPKSELEHITEDLGTLLNNEYSANLIYTQIEELFSIPKENSEKFAQRGKKSVSDWAEFIDENK